MFDIFVNVYMLKMLTINCVKLKFIYYGKIRVLWRT